MINDEVDVPRRHFIEEASSIQSNTIQSVREHWTLDPPTVVQDH